MKKKPTGKIVILFLFAILLVTLTIVNEVDSEKDLYILEDNDLTTKLTVNVLVSWVTEFKDELWKIPKLKDGIDAVLILTIKVNKKLAESNENLKKILKYIRQKNNNKEDNYLVKELPKQKSEEPVNYSLREDVLKTVISSTEDKVTTEVKKELSFEELAPTTTMSFEELVRDNGDDGNIPSYPPEDTYRVLVDVFYQFTTIYKKDENGKFDVPVRYMISTTGTTKTPTPIGIFEIEGHKVRFNRFEKFPVWAQYWTLLGDEIYFHSLLYEEKDANTYNDSYSKLGKRDSHGCIRLMARDAEWFYDNIGPGTQVEIIEGKKDKEQAAIREKLIFPPFPEPRITLVMGEIPITERYPGYNGPLTLPPTDDLEN